MFVLKFDKRHFYIYKIKPEFNFSLDFDVKKRLNYQQLSTSKTRPKNSFYEQEELLF